MPQPASGGTRTRPPTQAKPDDVKGQLVPPDDDDEEMSTDDDSYDKLDVSLRESLRILDDAINLGANHDTWVSNHAPLTVTADKG